MKQRVLVMNGQRIVQTHEKTGDWATQKIDKAGELRPGIYNIATAAPADKGRVTEGQIIHVDKDAVYQQVGKAFVRHDRADFQKPPDIGATVGIRYQNNQAAVTAPGPKLSRGVTR